MSHPLYNSYASVNQNRLSGSQAESDPLRLSSHLGHQSSISSSGGPSGTPDNSGAMVSLVVPHSVSYRPEHSRASVNEGIQRLLDIDVSRTRGEELLDKQLHKPTDQGTHRSKLHSSATGMTSNHHITGRSESESSPSSLSWLSDYSRPIADNSSTFHSASASSGYEGGGERTFERHHDKQPIPGLGDYDFSGPDKAEVPTEPSQPKYTSESAAKILLQFGLEREDMDLLLAYPEDQITPASLPFILRQIRIQKAKRVADVDQSKVNIPESPPTRNTGGIDGWISSRGTGMHQDAKPSSLHQPSKIIDYGHIGKYSGEIRDEMDRDSGSRAKGGSSESLLLDDFDGSGHNKELLAKGGRSSALASFCDQDTLSSSNNSTLRSVAPTTNDQFKGFQTQTTKSPHLSSSPLPVNNSDVRVVASEASKSISMKELEGDYQPTSKPQSSCSLLHGAHPGRSGLKAIGSHTSTSIKDQIKSKGKRSTVTEQPKISRTYQQAQTLKHQQKQVLPTPTMMKDYAGAPPRVFPHTCSLCNKECTLMKDWIVHQNSAPHLESCSVFRRQYPNWDGVVPIPSDTEKNTKPFTTTHRLHRHKTRHGGHSTSRSPSPHRHHSSEGRRKTPRSRSRSPHISRYTCRSPTSKLVGHRSRSRERLSSPRSTQEKTWSPERRQGNYSSPWRGLERCSQSQRSQERGWSPVKNRVKGSPKRSQERRSSPQRSQEKGRSPVRKRVKASLPKGSRERRSSPQRSQEKGRLPVRKRVKASLLKGIQERRSSPQKSQEKKALPERTRKRSSKKKKSRGAEGQSSKLQESSADQSELEAVIKSLAPAVLAELVKMKSFSSFLGSTEEKKSSSAASSSSSFSTAKEKGTVEAKSSAKTKLTACKKELNPSQRQPVYKVPTSNLPDSGISASPHYIPTIITRCGGMPTFSGPATVTKAKVLVSKAKSMSNKQTAKTVKGEGTVKKVAVKQKKCLVSKKPHGESKQKPAPNKSDSKVKKSTMLRKEKSNVDKLANTTVVRNPVDKSGPSPPKPHVKPPDCRKSSTLAGDTRTQKASIKIPETSVKTSFVLQQSPLPNTDSPPQGHETKKDSSLKQQQAAGSSGKPAGRTITGPTAGQFAESATGYPVVTAAGSSTGFAAGCLTEPTAGHPAGPATGHPAKLPAGRPSGQALGSSAGPTIGASTPSATGCSAEPTAGPSTGQAAGLSSGPFAGCPLGPAAEGCVGPAEKPDTGPTNGHTSISAAECSAGPSVEPSAGPATGPPTGASSESSTGPAAGCSAGPSVEPSGGPATGTPIGPPSESSTGPAAGCSAGLATGPSTGPTAGCPSRPAAGPAARPATRSAIGHASGPATVCSAGPAAGASTGPATGPSSGPAAGFSASLTTRPRAVGSSAKPAAGHPSGPAAGPSTGPAAELPAGPAAAGCSPGPAVGLPFRPAAGRPFGPANKANLTEGGAATKPRKTGTGTPIVAASLKDESQTQTKAAMFVTMESASSAVSKKPPAPPTPSSAAAPSPTVDKHLPQRIGAEIAVKTESSAVSLQNDSEARIKVATESQTAAASGRRLAASAAPKVPPLKGIGPMTAVKMSLNTPTKPTAFIPTASKQQPAAPTPRLTPSAGAPPLTLGEMVGKHLHEKNIACFQKKNYMAFNFCPRDKRHLLITNLPHNKDYTQGDIARLLLPFGFKYSEENIYVIPKACMAFVIMPTMTNVLNVVKASETSRFLLKGSDSVLALRVIRGDIAMDPLGFYKSVMKFMSSPVFDDGARTVYVKNISPDQATNLRETLRKIQCIRNYLPLLNKVFIEFETARYADLIGVWHSFLKQPPSYEIRRLNVHHCPSLPPRFPEKAVPDSHIAVTGATIPEIKFGIPQGSVSPFWLTMTTKPYVFSTMSPWFVIPEYLTVKRTNDIEEASSRGAKSPTIMLTGLPETQYKHEDIAELVWSYFSKRSLQSLYYNVIVLPLQRRAFVYFEDWTSCCNFVRDHFKSPVSVGGTLLHVHFVLQSMSPESREEDMYISLMKLSNAHVSAPESLEERLLCVEISGIMKDTIPKVVGLVACVAPFVNFLPLANRICIEMAQPSSVMKVVEKCNGLLQDYAKKFETWTKVQRFETMKSLKQHLQDSSKSTINLERNRANAKANLPPVPQPLVDLRSPASPESSDPAGSNISEVVTAGPSMTDARNEAGEGDCQTLEADNAMDSISPKANVNVEKSKGHVEEGVSKSLSTEGETCTSISCGSDVTAGLAKGGVLHKEKKEDQADFTHDSDFPIVHQLHQENFNMDDFVTVDEVGDDMENVSVDLPVSAKTMASSKDSKRRSFSVTSSKPSAPSLKDSKTSTLSSSNTSTKDKTTTRLSKSGEDISEELYEVVDSIEDELLPDAKYTESSGRWSLGGKTEKKQTSDVRKPVSDEEATFKILDSVDDDTAVATRSARGTKGRSTNAKTTQVEKPRRSRRTPASQDVAKEKPPKKEEEEPLKESTPSRMNDPLMKEEATYQILHSLEGKVKDDPPTAVGKVIRGRPKKEVVTEKHSTPFQKGNKGLSKIVVNEEVATYQILDSVEEEVKNDPPSAGRKGRSGRPKKEVMNNKGSMSLGKDPNELSETALNDEEATFQILDSVDDKVQDDSSAAWRKESQGSKEEMETTKREIALLLKNDKDLANMVMDEEEATYQILDSVEEEFKDDPPTEAKRGRRGRTKRGVRTKKGSMSLQKDHNELFEIAADEDDATYQILDSVEEEVQDDSSTAGRKDSQGPEAKIETTKKEIKLLQKDDDNLAKTEVDEEEATYQILDSVEEEVREDSQTEAKKRRRGRPKKEVPTKKVTTSLQKDHSEVSKIAGDEGEAAYQILDSVEDEVQDDAQTALRSGRGERPKREVTAKKGNTSLENENNESSEIAVDEEQATYQILDSVEDEVQDDAPTSRGEERPAGPKREFTTTEEDTKSASETADEEELTFQILDSVEEEMVDQQPLMEQPKSPKNHNCKFPQQENKEEEPVYQVVDSLSDQVGDELSDRARKGRMAEEETQKPQSNTAILGGQNKQTKRNTTAVTRSLGYLDEVSEEEEDYPDDTAEEEEVRERQASAKKKQLVKVRGDRKTTEREDRRSRERDEERRSRSCSRSERKRGEQEGELVTLYEVRADEPGEGINSTEVTSAQATLDEVSEEEEDFSDDTVEEEEVRKRQAAVKEKRFAKEEEERKNQEREERRSGEQEEREHRSSGEGTRRTTEEEQKEDVRAPESRGRARDITEEELQALVTLDEIVEEEEEEEEGKPCLLSQEDELAGSINPEVKSADVSFDFNTVEGVKERRTKEEEEEKDRKQEEVDDKDKVMAGEKSAAGNSMVPLDKEGHETAPPSQEDKSVDPFYLQTVTTLDEAGDDGEKKEDKGQPKEEEEEEQEEKEAPTPNTRGRGRKRSRRTPVRKSTRGKKGSEKEETQAAGSDVPPPTSVVAPSSLDLEIKKTASAGQELTPEQLDNQNPGGGKRKSEPVGPEAKRSRSQSPCVAATFELPAFRPDNPLGQEFLRSAYFCNVCAAFYLNETTTKEAHCCSQTHYDKLKKYYQELKEKSSRTSR